MRRASARRLRGAPERHGQPMELITTRETKLLWLGHVSTPSEFASPATGEYALLLVAVDDRLSPDEQADLSERLVRSGCRYAVCFGPRSSSWDDAIDMVGVMDEVAGREAPFVMTTWHDSELLEETVGFFADHTEIQGWSPSEFVALVLGDAAQLDRVRGALLRRFGLAEMGPWARVRAWAGRHGGWARHLLGITGRRAGSAR